MDGKDEANPVLLLATRAVKMDLYREHAQNC